MIQTTILAMLQRRVKGYEGHYLYIVREGETIFYIGQSLTPVSRMLEHVYGSRGHGPSHLGDFIRLFAEYADNWQVELLTLDDCKPYIDQYGTFCRGEEDAEKYWELSHTHNGLRDKYWQQYAINSAEGALIQHYRPCINIAGNPNPSPLPELYQ